MTGSAAVRSRPSTEDLAELYSVRGWSVARIGAECGWSGAWVRNQLLEAGVSMRPRARTHAGLDPLTVERAAEMAAQGFSAAEIAAASGYSMASVRRLLTRHGISVAAPVLPVDNEAAQVVALYIEEGLTMAAIAAVFGRSEAWVDARLKRAGVPIRQAGNARRDPDSEQVRRLLDAGVPVAEIAVQVGRSVTKLYTFLASQGWRPPPTARRRGPTLPPLDVEVIRRLYVEEGHTLMEVGEVMGCNEWRVRDAMKRAGIPRRSHKARPHSSLRLETLSSLYVEQGLNQAEIAAQLGCSANGVHSALVRFGIERRMWGGPPASFQPDEATLRELYVYQRLDDAEIAERFGVRRWHVRQRRQELNVSRIADTPAPSVAELRHLYLEQRRSVREVGRAVHASEPVTRQWLLDAGIALRPRSSRAQRATLDVSLLRELYEEREWSAVAIAAELDCSADLVRRTLHTNNITVRRSGSNARRVAGDTARIAELYADPEVIELLRRHAIPTRPEPGGIAERFPKPILPTRALLQDGYELLGLSAHHLELLTGYPAEQILDALHEEEMEVRAPSGPSPWLRRARDIRGAKTG